MRRQPLFLLLVGLLLGTGGAASASCEVPIAYAVGEVDSGYEISREPFHSAIRDAIRVWEEAAGRELFVHRPTAALRINLVYTQLQEATDRIQELEESTDSLRQRIERKQERLKAVKEQFQREQSRLEDKVRAFQRDKQAFEERVQRLKTEGGASAEEMAALRKRRQRLEQRRQALQDERDRLEDLKSRVNRFAVEINALVRRYNRRVRKAKEIARPGQELRQGLYQRGGEVGEAITIRQFDSPARLRFVLAHELGHALGLGHVDEPGAVMYYRNEPTTPEGPTLTEADRRALRRACGTR